MQEIRDKKTGWKPPDAPGSGAFKYNRLVYAKVRSDHCSGMARKGKMVVGWLWVRACCFASENFSETM